jgi:hypothetical protein
MRAIAQCPLCAWLSPEWTSNQERETAMKMWDEHRDAYHRPVPTFHLLEKDES